MSSHDDELRIPKPALWGALAIVLLAFSGTLAVRAGILPEVANPQAMRADANIVSVQQRDLVFADREDGAVVVTEVSGTPVAVIMPDSEQGFVRGLMRGLARERRLREATMDKPFRLELWSDNGLTLTDLATGRQIELGSFGPTNRAAFAVMLPAQGAAA